MADLTQASGEYLEFLEARGLAPATIMSAKNMFSRAMAVWGDLPINEIEPRHIDQFFAGRSWSPGTSNIYLGVLRGFLKWCRTHRYLRPDYDPTEGWKAKKVPKTERTWLTLPVLQALMDAAASSRDRAFLAIGIYTFMRAGEITSLKIGDIDLERSELRIYRFKTQQNDRLPICLELQAELSAWLAIYRSRCGDLDPSWYLCPSQGPTPMKGVEGERRLIPTGGEPPLKPTRKITQPQRIVKHAMAVLNVGGKGDGCHVLRRSGARALYEQLRDLGHDGAARRVQSMLGHASMLMTEKYLGLDHERSQRNEMLAGRSMFGPARSPIGSSSPLALEASPMPHL